MITSNQKDWLEQHGDRTEDDVKLDNDGKKYVIMGGKDGEDVNVYLPE